MWYKTHVLPLQFQYDILSYHIFKKKHNHIQSILRKSPTISLNLCTIWKVNSDFYLLATLGIFGNYFFSLFFVFKNNFLFIKLKNLFDNPKWTENKKIVFKTQFVKETENMQKADFSSDFQKSMKTCI